ncbi:hypothetical protein CKM354_000712400 [Cercospora kikuchii]|uniref:gamma-glutamylcyclotransferase n=1 Tax=Cercospora kikuchii TaxID=84275 RepID=A0A9P3CM62_9PEZI|nr:uncharacterized protein CKM354_000712400 [Cercospora kikuchii]GIZ43912.1 hypothetical protein CKM354_000712400 [Cercospora kikuchii]
MDTSASSTLHLKLSLSHRSSVPSNDTMTTAHQRTIYFGYGSNLWLHQMRQRCPTSKYLGIARLKGYKWIIYDRGYANIIELSEEEKQHDSNDKHDYLKEVWGLVYSLEHEDERRLDVNEGVAHGAYSKEWIECEFWTASSERTVRENTAHSFSYVDEGKPDTSKKPGKTEMLVYINRENAREGKIKEEYVYRMNKGIRDALKEGVPRQYVEQVLREWIPDVEDERLGEVARRQALEFEDER